MEEKMNQERLAALAGNPDETQIVSLKDLEELELLQLTGGGETTGGGKGAPAAARRAAPFGMVLGLLAALCLAAVLTALYVHHGAQPAAVQSVPQGNR